MKAQSAIPDKIKNIAQIAVYLEENRYFYLISSAESSGMFLSKIPNRDDLVCNFLDTAFTSDIFTLTEAPPSFIPEFLCIFCYDEEVIKVIKNFKPFFVFTIPFKNYTPEYLLSCLTFLK